MFPVLAAVALTAACGDGDNIVTPPPDPPRPARGSADLIVADPRPPPRPAPDGVVLPGTVWEAKNVIAATDPTALDSIRYTGRERGYWDAQVRRWVTLDSLYLFEAVYNGHVIEYQVHPVYGSVDSARVHMDTYAATLG